MKEPTSRGSRAGDAPKPGRSGTKTSAYERIRSAILDGTLAPGAPLVEAALAEWCEVSRTPVREALTRLEQDGLVERGDRGLAVRQLSLEEILEMHEIRIVLEGTAARFAAERHTNFDRIRLERLLAEQDALTDAAPEQRAELNRSFHRSLSIACHSGVLIDLLGRLELHLARYSATTLNFPGRWDEALEEHRQMVEAVLDRDGDAAAQAATKHFTTARDIRIKLWEQQA